MTDRPKTPLLDRVRTPADMRNFNVDQLRQLADELRAETVDAVSVTGGHLGAGLGVVELTVALHYVFNTPEDKLVWDVGHQAYPHKILTGRKERMLTMRQKDGLAAFPRREESEYDTFGVGHSSTSISAALGMAIARQLVEFDHGDGIEHTEGRFGFCFGFVARIGGVYFFLLFVSGFIFLVHFIHNRS